MSSQRRIDRREEPYQQPDDSEYRLRADDLVRERLRILRRQSIVNIGFWLVVGVVLIVIIAILLHDMQYGPRETITRIGVNEWGFSTDNAFLVYASVITIIYISIWIFCREQIRRLEQEEADIKRKLQDLRRYIGPYLVGLEEPPCEYSWDADSTPWSSSDLLAWSVKLFPIPMLWLIVIGTVASA